MGTISPGGDRRVDAPDRSGEPSESSGERTKSLGDGPEPHDRHGRRWGSVATSRSARTELLATHRRRIADAWHSLWLKPAIAVVSMLALGAALSRIRVEPGSFLWPVSFKANAEDARQMLTVIIGALIPVTSLVFALTVVTLQIASTQFSPRLLRTFLRDRGTQLVLSCFVGTIAFSLANLFTVDSDESDPAGDIPRFAITVALAMALVCIGLLVYYFGHITNAVRIDTVMRQVEADTRRTLRREHPIDPPGAADPDQVEVVPAPPHAIVVEAPGDGYVQGVDERLPDLTVRKHITVVVLPLVGYYVVAGRPLALAWRDDGEALKPTTLEALTNLVEVDPERRVECDVGLGIRQLVDIASRAMSTGQNDPYTGTQAVHHLTTLLVDAARRPFRTQVFRDRDGTPRVVVPVMDFPTHLRVVCGHIRQGGLERHPRVVLEVLRMLGVLGEAVITHARLIAVRDEVDVLLADAQRMIQSPHDLDEVQRLGAVVRAELDARIDAGATSPVTAPGSSPSRDLGAQ